MEPITQQVVSLKRELDALKEESDKLNAEARKWAEKRDSIHEQMKELRKEAADLREKRDALNKEAQEAKGYREKAKKERRERRAQILKLKGRLRTLMKKKPPKGMREIQKEIESLDWRVQTTSLTLEDEKSLVDRVRLLEGQLLVHKQIQKLKETIFELQTEGDSLKVQAGLHHEKLSKLAQQSQIFHEKMLENMKQIRTLRLEADSIHQKYVQTKQQARDLHQKRLKLSRQIGLLQQKLRRAEEEKQTERQHQLRKELEERALEKLKRGEKLTWEEFTVLAEKGIL